jgi:hypothetical protein
MSEIDYLGIISICQYEMVTIQKILIYDHLHLENQSFYNIGIESCCFHILSYLIVSYQYRIVSYQFLVPILQSRPSLPWTSTFLTSKAHLRLVFPLFAK